MLRYKSTHPANNLGHSYFCVALFYSRVKKEMALMWIKFGPMWQTKMLWPYLKIWEWELNFSHASLEKDDTVFTQFMVGIIRIYVFVKPIWSFAENFYYYNGVCRSNLTRS